MKYIFQDILFTTHFKEFTQLINSKTKKLTTNSFYNERANLHCSDIQHPGTGVFDHNVASLWQAQNSSNNSYLTANDDGSG